MSTLRIRIAVTAIGILLSSTSVAHAQDTRTVTEPVIPPICTVLNSQLAIVSGEPASETTLDTSRIQTALTACPAGQGVELAASGTNYAFLTGPLNIPTGVTLVIDGGVTLFASRNPADYQVGTVGGSQEACGTTGTNGNGCKTLLTVNNGGTSNNAGIMGYGVIDGRGEDKLLVSGTPSTISWWDNASNAQALSNNQSNPIMLLTGKANNFTLYKITVKNSPMFHLKWSSGNGFTAWGVKVITPYTARNTDGLDISGSNATVINASISDGDDDVAISAASASSNMTVTKTNTYSGHGISIGSYTQGGFSNLLVDTVNMAGTAADSNAVGLRIKSAADRGGLVQNVTYQNICMQNMKSMISLTPFYNSNTGTSIPQFKNITFSNIQQLTEGTVGSQGYDVNHPTTVTYSNVTFDLFKSTDYAPAPTYTAFTLSNNVFPTSLQAPAGTGVTISGTASSASSTTGLYACPTTNFPSLVGDLYLNSGAQTASINSTQSVTLKAIVQPAMSQVTYGAWTGVAGLTKSVSFLEGSTVVGTGTLSGNGTLATFSFTPAVGTHTYTASYPVDGTYSALSFGSVTVVVTGALTSSTAVTATPATVNYGTATALKATVTGTTTAPTGAVQFYDNGSLFGSVQTLSSVSGVTNSATLNATLTGGTHSITAVYNGDLTYAGSTSTTAASATVTPVSTTTTLAALPASATYGTTITLTANVAASAGTATLTGTVTFTDGGTTLGSSPVSSSGAATFAYTLPALGAHTISASYSGDTNYAASSTTVTQSESITQSPTTTALSLSTSNVTYGTAVTFTATVTDTAGVVPTGTVSFYDGSTLLGPAVALNTTGVATGSYTLPIGSHTNLTAVYSGDTNFITSTSTAHTETVNTPFVLTVAPTTASASIGGAAVTATTTVTPAVTGYSGLVTYGCSAPVSYVVCGITPGSSTLSGTTTATATVSIFVTATVSETRPARSSAVFAVLLPFAGILLLPFVRRRSVRAASLLMLAVALMVAAGVSGCTPGTTVTGSGTGAKTPTGTQTVTITATGAAYVSSATLTLNITN